MFFRHSCCLLHGERSLQPTDAVARAKAGPCDSGTSLGKEFKEPECQVREEGWSEFKSNWSH